MLFAGTVIRSGNEIVGTLAIEIPVEAINLITGTEISGKSTGLDDIDTYIVADDLLLQSTPEAWFDDPERYLDGIDDAEVRRLVDALGSPVGIQ